MTAEEAKRLHNKAIQQLNNELGAKKPNKKKITLLQQEVERTGRLVEEAEAEAKNDIAQPNTTQPNTTRPNTKTEHKLKTSEKKAEELADSMNKDDPNKKADAEKAAADAKERANAIDDNIEFNIPMPFWKEAKEMAPTDKAKRGFLIHDYVTKRLGTALNNIGVAVSNAGGSGGGTMMQHGNSLIDKYRDSKLEQAISNRKAKQNSILQQQIDTLIAIGIPENEARQIQNRLRNIKFSNKYARLTNEQQLYIQALLTQDTRGQVTDAVLGSLVDKMLEGNNVAPSEAATTVLTGAGIDNSNGIIEGAKSIGKKLLDAFVPKW